MNSFYHCKSIINKEIFLFFGVCLSFLYCFICAMSKALHFLSIILYYRIVNEATTYIFIFWCDKFSILFQQVFNKVCNLSNFFKIRNIELGYTLPEKISSLIKLKSLKIYFRGGNLLTLSKIKDLDPENLDAGITNFPLYRTLTGGVSITF